MKTGIKVVVDLTIHTLDFIGDIRLASSLLRQHHYNWFASTICIVFLPNLAGTIHSVLHREQNTDRFCSGSLCIKNFITLFFYPFFIYYLGIKLLWRIFRKPANQEQKKKRILEYKSMVYYKVYNGFLESSPIFLLQVIMIQACTPVGEGYFDFLGENGSLIEAVIGATFAFISQVYTASQYHYLLASRETKGIRMILIALFYICHASCRVAILSLLFIYWKWVTLLAVIIPLLASNFLLTRDALKNDLYGRNFNMIACSVYGSIISLHTPTLAVAFSRTVEKKTMLKFYRRNIACTNAVLGICLVIMLGIHNYKASGHDNPENIFKDEYLMRHHLFGCKPSSDNEIGWKNSDSSINPKFTSVSITARCTQLFGVEVLARSSHVPGTDDLSNDDSQFMVQFPCCVNGSYLTLEDLEGFDKLIDDVDNCPVGCMEPSIRNFNVYLGMLIVQLIVSAFCPFDWIMEDGESPDQGANGNAHANGFSLRRRRQTKASS